MISLDKMYSLKYMVRYNNIPRITDESVIEHTGFVNIILMQMYLKYDFDLHKALKIATIHDVGEAFISDIPANIKADNPVLKKEIAKIELDVFDKHFNEFKSLFVEYEEQKTITSKFVKLADLYSVLQYTSVEVKLGNKGYMKDINENSRKKIDKLLEEVKSYER